MIYAKAGHTTAAIPGDHKAFVENVLLLIACKDIGEANYFLVIIRSEALYAAATPLMNKGLFGTRDLHKHLWKLPILEFDVGNPLRWEVAEASETVAQGAAARLAE